jgi:hypothetical protein
MPRLGLRLRLLVGRAFPHTPMKRALYGVLMIASIGLGVYLRLEAGVALAAVTVFARTVDIALSNRRRSRRPDRPYFFEGGGPAAR